MTASPLLALRETPLRTLLPAWRPSDAVVPRWEQHAGAYINALRLSVRPGTAATYLEVLARFVRFIQGGGPGTDPLDASRADIERFLSRERSGRRDHLRGERAAGTTVTERAGLRRYFVWAQREELRPDNPTDGVGAPRRIPYRDVRALSADEARQLVAAIPINNPGGSRLRVLVTWFLVTGRRHSEVLRLRWSDVDLEDRTYIYEGKGGKVERRELVPDLVTEIERWRNEVERSRKETVASNPDALVFPGRYPDQPVSPQLIRAQLQLVAEKAGIGALRRPIHTLRHTNARLRRETGASIEEVQAALDHSSLATTAVYLRKLEGTTDPHGASIAALFRETLAPAAAE